MAVPVRELYNSVKSDKIRLLAGKEGLNRSVRWVHMVESTEMSTFLEGGEITFTTGVGMLSDEELYDMVDHIIENGGSGIVINVGPYIQSIPENLIELCENKQVPLFSVAWSVHMAEIMRSFSLTITLSEMRQLEIDSAVKNAILFPEQKELYVPHMEGHGYGVNDSYTVALLKLSKEPEENRRRILIYQMENLISNQGWHCTVMKMESCILLLFAGEEYSEEKLESCLKTLVVSCPMLQKDPPAIGVGQMTRNIYCIAKSYRQAKSVLDLSEMNIRDTCFYSRLGLYKLLLNVADREVIRNYVDEVLGPLIRYDEMNDNNLLEVLRVYLKNNGSLKESAEELFVHRNTVNYKIRRIGDLLERSLSDYETCAQLHVALKLYDIMGKEIGHIA